MFREWYHVARADLLVRLRDRRLLAVVAASVYLGRSATVGDIQLVLGDYGYRGVYNAAWIGTIMALAASAAIALFGFYLVKDAVARDSDGGPDGLVAASPIRTLVYLFGKWTSNVAVLSLLASVMAATVVALLALRGTGSLALRDVLLPFVLLTLPVAALVAAVAILFETTPVLRGSVGNVLYFFGLVGLLIASPVDPVGGTFVKESMEAALTAQYPAYDGGGYVFGQVADSEELRTFRWEGVAVTADLLGHRLGYLLASVLVVIGAVVPFRRFDPGPDRAVSLPGRSWSPSMPAIPSLGGLTASDDATPSQDSEMSVAELRRFDGSEQSLRPLGLFAAELRMALRGRSTIWYLGAGVLVGAGLLAGLGTATGGSLIVAWIWPLFVWSEMGAREHEHHTESLVFSSNYPVTQLAASWFAGVAVAALFVAPVVVRLLAAGSAATAGGILVGVFFVPSFALAAGVVSESSRPFEVGYLLLWYLGIANRTPSLDYGGVTDQPTLTVIGFAVAGAALLATAFLVRRRRLQ